MKNANSEKRSGYIHVLDILCSTIDSSMQTFIFLSLGTFFRTCIRLFFIELLHTYSNMTVFLNLCELSGTGCVEIRKRCETHRNPKYIKAARGRAALQKRGCVTHVYLIRRTRRAENLFRYRKTLDTLFINHNAVEKTTLP